MIDKHSLYESKRDFLINERMEKVMKKVVILLVMAIICFTATQLLAKKKKTTCNEAKELVAETVMSPQIMQGICANERGEKRAKEIRKNRNKKGGKSGKKKKSSLKERVEDLELVVFSDKETALVQQKDVEEVVIYMSIVFIVILIIIGVVVYLIWRKEEKKKKEDIEKKIKNLKENIDKNDKETDAVITALFTILREKEQISDDELQEQLDIIEKNNRE